MPEPRSVWDDLQFLAASVDHVISFEHEVRPRPPLVCEPTPVDWEWPPSQRMPDSVWDEDEIQACRVHRDECWPCQAFREGRGVQEQSPETVQVLTMRPKGTRDA